MWVMEAREAQMKKINSSLSWDTVAEKLSLFGPEERALDTSSSAWRVKLPDAYFQARFGFRSLLINPWVMFCGDDDLLVATPVELMSEYLARRRRELCDVGKMSQEAFRTLHESLRYRVVMDTRMRWAINPHLALRLHFRSTENNCRVVFQTREATIEIHTLGRYRRELAQAQDEMNRVLGRGSVPAAPGNTQELPA